MTAWHSLILANIVGTLTSFLRRLGPAVLDKLHVTARWSTSSNGGTVTWSGRSGRTPATRDADGSNPPK